MSVRAVLLLLTLATLRSSHRIITGLASINCLLPLHGDMVACLFYHIP
jgi:hypothetical protein